ncbi:hypothetical protein DVH24_030561 [Malus domestica]|uniref:Uncharacterized protein n=1 Tax=Malus domestica TaxID=3750 RepID=A0A498JXE9_MALDO|nr:hypothetical protein DVH24_030561 [Malus domestica]
MHKVEEEISNHQDNSPVATQLKLSSETPLNQSQTLAFLTCLSPTFRSGPCPPKGAGALESRVRHSAWCFDLPESMLRFEHSASLVVLLWFGFENLAVALFGSFLLMVAFFRSGICVAWGSYCISAGLMDVADSNGV